MTVKRPITDRLLLSFSIVGLVLLAFVSGAIVMEYRLPPRQALYEAFQGGEALFAVWTNPYDHVLPYKHQPNDIPSSERIKQAMNAPRVSHVAGKAYDGYTLINVRDTTTVFLLDMAGRIVYRWDAALGKPANPKAMKRYIGQPIFVESVQLEKNGDLIAQYAGLKGTQYGYGIIKMDKDSNALWNFDDNMHHFIYLDPDTQDIYGLVYNYLRKPLPGLERLHYPVSVDSIVRLSKDGQELDRISILEAFQGSPFEILLFHPPIEKKNPWSQFHTNSVVKLEASMAPQFPMFKAGDLLVSMRDMNTIAVIDPITRKVTWAYQGPWLRQHSAKFLPNGTIAVFDNRGHYADDKTFSRVVEIDPKTLAPVWSYAGTKDNRFFSLIYGYLQRLPNGNTLIAETMDLRVIEVTPQGEIVWSYALPQLRRAPGPERGILTATRFTKEELPFLKE